MNTNFGFSPLNNLYNLTSTTYSSLTNRLGNTLGYLMPIIKPLEVPLENKIELVGEEDSQTEQVIDLKSIEETQESVAAKGKEVILKSSEAAEKDKVFHCSVIPTLHCADTQEWRKRLILSAQHNIVISGNYCGGKALDDLLKLIEKQMEKIPNLQVLIIGHPDFLTDKPKAKVNPHMNKKRLANLRKKYPERFCFVNSPDIYYGAKKVTNHTKCTIIDFGRYYIQGGSGIKDNFALTGLDDLTVEQYLEADKVNFRQKRTNEEVTNEMGKNQEVDAQEEEGPPTAVLEETSPKSIMGSISDEKTEEKNATTDGGIIGLLIPGNFRDQDFVFECEKDGLETGTRMYREALLLAYKWDQFNKDNKHRLPPESWDLDDFEPSKIHYPALRDLAFPEEATISKDDNVLYRMLKTQVPDLNSITTQVVEFDENPKKIMEVGVKLFFTGPEQKKQSPFTKEIVASIRAAKKEIVVNHMYFQPTTEVMIELINAVKRGVKLTIVTAGVTKNCPNSQKIFGPRNEYNYYYLLTSLQPHHRENVKIYEYEQDKKGLHKKVVIIDDQIFAGSSNLGYKSLALMGDHEMNFKAQSQNLVDQTMQIIDEDIKHSRVVKKMDSISYHSRLMAITHSLGSRIWG